MGTIPLRHVTGITCVNDSQLRERSDMAFPSSQGESSGWPNDTASICGNSKAHFNQGAFRYRLSVLWKGRFGSAGRAHSDARWNRDGRRYLFGVCELSAGNASVHQLWLHAIFQFDCVTGAARWLKNSPETRLHRIPNDRPFFRRTSGNPIQVTGRWSRGASLAHSSKLPWTG
jgi:hypothetical protein